MNRQNAARLIDTCHQIVILAMLMLLLALPATSATAGQKLSAGGHASAVIGSDGTFWGWGSNLTGALGDGTLSSRGTPAKSGPDSDWVTLSTNGSHTVAIKANGTLWAWGDNTYGALGCGSACGDPTVPQQIGTDTNWQEAAAGGAYIASGYTIAIKSDGTLWSWGYNSNGQLGDGTTTNRTTPARVGTESNWVKIAAGIFHVAAIRADGTLWTWGDNYNDKLGCGTTCTSTLVPQKIGTDNKWVTVSASDHTLAVKVDGSLWGWGQNANKQVANVPDFSINAPRAILFGTSKVVMAAAGRNHSAVVTANGEIWTWGINAQGQLGDGTSDFSNPNPKQIVAVPAGSVPTWTAVAAGESHTLARRSDGTVWTWGYNYYGQLGDATAVGKNIPTKVPWKDGKWVAPAGGFHFSGALKADGSLWTWGRNDLGQLGIGSYTDMNQPVRVNGNTWVSLTAGHEHMVALQSDGTLWAWGNNGAGQLGNASFTPSNSPIPIGSDNSWASISAGGAHTAALKANGTLWSWGYSGFGQLGCGAACSAGNAPQQIGAAMDWASIATGSHHTLALKSNGTLWSMGWNQYGQLGDSSTVNRDVPTLVQVKEEFESGGFALPGWKFKGYGEWTVTDSVAAHGGVWSATAPPVKSGEYASMEVSQHCVMVSFWYAIDSENSLEFYIDGVKSGAWTGSTGYKYASFVVTPGKHAFRWVYSPGANPSYTAWIDDISFISNSWVAVAAGYAHTSALRADGTLWTWGANWDGQLGDGTNVGKNYPVQIGSATDWAAVAAGGDHTVALKADGTLWGWGRNDVGQLGDGTGTYRYSPVQIGTDRDWVSIATGLYQTIAVKADGTIWTWGHNPYGGLGDGTTINRHVPTALDVVFDWRSVATGLEHTLGVRSNGTLWAWGDNRSGQLGIGSNTDSTVPMQVGTDSDWLMVSAGAITEATRSHSLALKSDGTLWAWGNNSDGQIGDGTPFNRLTPVQIGTDMFWSTVSAGGAHSMGLKSDGTLWGWGKVSSFPILIPAPIANRTWVSVSAGEDFTYGILSDGTLWGWGSSSTVPAMVGSDTNWLSVSAGYRHIVAVKTDGTLWAWGFNESGQLGNNSTTNSNVPVRIGSTQKWVAAVAGRSHTVALDSEGRLWAWGSNAYGQLGDGTGAQRNVPTLVGTDSDWTAIFDAYNHTVAVKKNGKLYVWGRNSQGQIGDGTTTNRLAAGEITAQLNVSIAGLGSGTVAATGLICSAGSCSGNYGYGASVVLTAQPSPESSFLFWSGCTSVNGPVCTIVLSHTTNSVLLYFNDTSRPTGTISIAADYTNGTKYTKNPALNLTLSATDPVGVSQMRFSVDNSSWSAAVPYSTSYQYTLQSPADGMYNVYVQFRDLAGNWSSDGIPTPPPISDSITLKRTGPTGASITIPADYLNSSTGKRYVRSSTLNLALTASDVTGVAEMQFSNDGSNWSAPELYFATRAYVVPAGSGSKTVYVRFRDRVGNWSGAVSDTVIYDPDPPTGSLVINNDDRYNNSSTVNLTLACSDPLSGCRQMKFSPDGVNGWSLPEPFSTSKTGYQLGSGPGTLFSWGINNYGQLGLGTIGTSPNYGMMTAPQQVGIENQWSMISSKHVHTAAIRSDGTLWAWGSNYFGTLGNGTVTDSTVPIQVGAGTTWTAVAAGNTHTLALKADGSLWAWGNGGEGQLGTGSYNQQNAPVQILTSDAWIAIAAGGSHSAAIRSDGALFVWGYNNYGQLGINSDSLKTFTPQQISGSWKSVSLGDVHTAAVKIDGTLWTWGYNGEGELGLGTSNNWKFPQQVGNDTDWSSVTAGWSHTLALKSSGALYAFGWNPTGQLGDGSSTNRHVPVPVSSGSTWKQVSASANHSAGIRSDDTLWTWGYNNWGSLGIGTNTSSLVPVSVEPTAKWKIVTAGNDSTFGIKQPDVYGPGTLSSWGLNNSGQLGLGTIGSPTYDKNAPQQVGSENQWSMISSNELYTAAIRSDGTLWTWGNNTAGKLGNGSAIDSNVPIPVQVGTDTTWTAVATALYHTLALKADGSLWAWGSNWEGQMGVPGYNWKDTPVQILVPSTTWKAIAAGGKHSAAITSAGDLFVWGRNDYGQVGINSNTTYILTPQQIPGTWKSVSLGELHTAAVKNDGTLWTWGYNNEGQLGLGTSGSPANNWKYPQQVGNATDWSSVTAGCKHTLALKNNGSLYAFGRNANGELGDGSSTQRNAPVPIASGSIWKQVQAGQNHSAGIKSDDTLWTWGYNVWGSLGNGTNTTSLVPVPVEPATKWKSVATGNDSTFGIKVSDTRYVFAKFSDNVGNWSPMYSDEIIQDFDPPTGAVVINNAAPYTTSQNVALALNCNDLISGCATMEFREAGGNWSPPDSFGFTKNWMLTPANGAKNVEVRFTDKAGNASIYISSIILDNTKPATSATPPGSVSSSFATPQTVTLSCSDGSGSGCAGTWYAIDSVPPTGLTPTIPYTAPLSISKEATLVFRSVDALGNTEAIKSATYTFVQGYTRLALELSTPVIDFGGKVTAFGRLQNMTITTANPLGNNADPTGEKVTLKIQPVATSLDPTPTPWTVDTFIYNKAGQFSLDLTGFDNKRTYIINASFGGSSLLSPSDSAGLPLLVGASAGYAILVEGKLPGQNPEGIASHNKTTNRIYQKLKARGFVDDNIYYFNYDTTQKGVDAVPSKTEIQSAVQLWAKSRMNGLPAPLYLIMVDHGSVGEFKLGDETISPTNLAAWLTTLEAGLDAEALLEKRVVIIGSCFSGSFIEKLSKGPRNNATSGLLEDAGRVIITSAAPNEVSYKGPQEESGIRSGEYFLEELFTQLERGRTIRDSFIEAGSQTRTYTQKGGTDNTNSNAPWFDGAVQHPLLDDNGDHAGSNSLGNDPTQDGATVASMVLGVGAGQSTNSALNPIEIDLVTPSVHLSTSQSSADLWAAVNDTTQVDTTVWVEIRYMTPELTTTSGTEQVALNTTKTPMVLNTTTNRYELINLPGFTENGRYDVYYFVRDKETLKLAPMKRSVVYHNFTDDPFVNPPPPVPDMTGAEPPNGSHQSKYLYFGWGAVSDSTPAHPPITYSLIISENANPTYANAVYFRDNIPTNNTVVGPEGRLAFDKTYHWKIRAVDRYGAYSESAVMTFDTFFDQNADVVVLKGTVKDAANSAALRATVTVTKPPTTFSRVAVADVDGSYFFSNLGTTGTFTVTTAYAGYTTDTRQVTIVSQGSLTTFIHNVLMSQQGTQLALTVSVDGTGSGTVTSSPQASGGISCQAGSPDNCSASFPAAQPVALSATTSFGSVFSGWTCVGCMTDGTSCTLASMNTDKSVTATFNTTPPFFLYSATPTLDSYRSFLQVAYDDAADNGIIQMQATIPAGGLTVTPASGKTVTIQGGFDAGFTPNPPDTFTTIQGKVTLQNGTLKVQRVKVK